MNRSIASYELLGFAVSVSYRVEDRLDWVSLQSSEALLMLAHADSPSPSLRSDLPHGTRPPSRGWLRRSLPGPGEERVWIGDPPARS